MTQAAIRDTADPGFERERQKAVDQSGILRGKAAPELQRIVDRAVRAFHVPIAAITVIDRARQWFAGRSGIDDPETPRSVSFCAHAILRPGEPMVVEDATQDARFANNPMVAGEPGIRFYAGVPLIDRMGYPLGALCVVDTKPRPEPSNLVELTWLAQEAEQALRR